MRLRRNSREEIDFWGILEVKEIRKNYGGVAALKGVSLQINPGQIFSLVGENGAGKSTLGKILSGIVDSYSGEILLNGNKVDFANPREAMKHGIVTIAQELAIVPTLTIAENVLLGEEPKFLGIILKRKLRKKFLALTKQVGFEFDPDTIAGYLSIAEQQKVEILRALSRKANIIIMDEPTASLSNLEAKTLYKVMRALALRGKTVILISHFLKEVLELSQNVAVLRDGKLVSQFKKGEVDEQTLIENMIGHSIEESFPPKTFTRHGSPALMYVDKLSAPGISNIWMSVRAGEIIGVAGLVGSGRSEMVRAIYQDSKLKDGEVRVLGAKLRGNHPRKALNKGIVFLPESRKDLGLFLERSILENVSISNLKQVSTLTWIKKSKEKEMTRKILEATNVKYAKQRHEVSRLSGGNQQKVLFARMLLNSPKILIVDEPTKGVDVGSKRGIYDLICDLAKNGMAVIVISSDLEEVLGLAHRVLVMKNGNVVSELAGSRMHEKSILEASFGING